MKKFICGFLIGAMLFGTIGAFAVSYVANPVDFKVMVNGKEFVSDPPALEVEGRTYLPLRAMGEALGVPVSWNEELRQAEVGTSVATEGQKNALEKAKSYLSITSFSYEGLITQLEFEQFTTEEAVYGADNCGANWNEEAVKKAKSYLEITSFSRKGLINQLEFEKFTTEEATYGADNCGANWNEQAAKKAKSYLEITSFSKQGLIDQLEFEGFTAAEALYGVTAVGY